MEKNWYKSKKFWGAFLVALAFWGYVSLNDNYNIVITVPLTVEPPQNRANLTSLPNKINTDISGTGWSLINNLYFNNIKRCHIKLDDIQTQDSIYTITPVDMQKGLQNLTKVSFNRFVPNAIKIITTKLDSKEIEVIPKINIEPAIGFSQVGKVKVSPANVTIKGNRELLKNIEQWFTEQLTFENVTSSFSKQVYLADSMSSIVKVVPEIVTISAAIQHYAELTLEDIPIKIKGSNKILSNYSLKPHHFSITLSGGIDIIKKLDNNDVSIAVQYKDIVNGSTGILKPEITIPPYTKLVKIEPEYIFYNKIVQQL